MENSILRPSLVRGPPQNTGKDLSRGANRNPPAPQPRHSVHVRRNFCRRTFSRRDLTSLADEALESISYAPQLTDSSNSQPCLRSECLADGYAYSSSQLRLCPGSLPKFTESGDEVPCWDLVAEVCLISESPLQCPICLNSPIIPRMERCAHIYCGPCAVQYILYENDFHSKKCAVCSWIMHLQDLKRVVISYVAPLQVGSCLDMSLVRRSRMQSTQSAKDFEVADASCCSVFDRIVELNPSELSSSNVRDLETLATLKADCLSCGDTEVLPYINMLMDQLNAELQISKGDTRATSVPNSLNQSLTDDPNMYYQASDGRLIFLDGLMWSCLLSEYGSTNLPQHMKVSVTSIRNQKMTSTARKRWRHLIHVPLGHWFTFIEIDLTSLISQRVLEQFASPLRARSEERNRKLLEDLRLTQLKEAAENQLPHLPPGFVLAGHADLSDTPMDVPSSSSFPSLHSQPRGLNRTFQPSKHSRDRPTFTFAEVTKSGARLVVDQNRVANFSRNTIEPVSKKCFDPAMEVWPSLNASCDTSVLCTNNSVVQSTDVQPKALNSRSRRRRNKLTQDSASQRI